MLLGFDLDFGIDSRGLISTPIADVSGDSADSGLDWNVLKISLVAAL